MYRNPNNGNFTFTARRYTDFTSPPNNAYFCEMNGQTSNHPSLIFSYGSNYNFLWKTENTGTDYFSTFYFKDLVFDANNNIYTTGKGIYGPNNTNTFLGYSASSTELNDFSSSKVIVFFLIPAASGCLS